ncbi:TPA: nodulation protein NfeD [Methanosarcina acetivorans]|uniref:Nodulation protein NfeD n=2 Tax=Methanosarcina acetivorans TaxID=2214 RepID=Q8TS89_METAC|nr:nodulation protein NfeD [Methanosarcina acetivorans]AAM04348.1 nodulation protein NfeD [Methanosarcina acetivorans C2A]HIH93530.1 nodulation protein NfeD [Methanosarcina acetivorans]
MQMKWVSHSLFIFCLCVTLTAFLAPSAGAAAEDKVLVLEISGAITPASDNLIADAIQSAESGNYEALVITLDTPGGGLEETQIIIKAIENTTMPVIGYVPESGKAWSAGTLILMGTDIAAMAPFTVIGSAQPVQVSAEGTVPVEDEKTINALVKFSTETARKHGRNETFAEEVITENRNLNAEEALEEGVIEYIAISVPNLLNQVDGEIVKGKELHTANATTETYKPPLPLSFLTLISNPILSSLLLTIGIYGIIFGISNPGAGAELFGVIAIVLGLIGTGFDINIAALFLIIVGIGLLILELNSPGFGIFGLAGIICLVIGSIFLVPLGSENIYTPEFRRLMILTIVTPTIVFGIFLVFAIYKVAETRKKKPVIGAIIGDTARTIDPIGPKNPGFVRYKGEYWQAKAEEEIGAEEEVEITGKEMEVLVVKRKI